MQSVHVRLVGQPSAACGGNAGLGCAALASRSGHTPPAPRRGKRRCNEVVVGCTSSDWLLACSSQEISRAEGPVDRLPTLAAHVLAQRK